MTFIDSIILGIVEGITEFLPISSTGHLILASFLLHLQETEFLKSFEISIQLGAILSVVLLYARTLVTDRQTIQKLVVAFFPTGVIGLLAYKTIKQYLLGSQHVVLLALLVVGVVLIVFEVWHSRKADKGATEISYLQAFLIGIFQSCAIIPGVSRSGATIIGGLALGIERRTIVEFSFLLAIPTMAAATGLDLLKSGAHFSAVDFELLAVGFLVSFVVALLSIKFLLHYIQNHTFIAFGVYRVIVAVLFWLLVM